MLWFRQGSRSLYSLLSRFGGSKRALEENELEECFPFTVFISVLTQEKSGVSETGARIFPLITWMWRSNLLPERTIFLPGTEFLLLDSLVFAAAVPLCSTNWGSKKT